MRDVSPFSHFRICDLTQLFVLEGYQYAPSSGRYRSAMGGPTQLFELRADMDMSYLCTAAAEIALYLRPTLAEIASSPVSYHFASILHTLCTYMG